MRDGKPQIAIQVRYKNQSRQIFTGLYIDEKHFIDGKVTGIKNADWYNTAITKTINELESGYLKQQLAGTPISLKSESVINRQSFIKYAKNFYKTLTASDGYKLRAVADIQQLEDFAGDISFEKLSPQLLKDFEQYMVHKKLSRNTINKIFKRVKQPVKMAVREGLISKDPFYIYTPPTYQQPDVDFLTMEEITKIEKLVLNENLSPVRWWFIFCCYTGLRYSDAAAFDITKHVVTTKGVKRIILTTKKTKGVVSIKLSEKIQGIIKQITRPIPTNVHCGRILNEIIIKAKIKRHIHWHCSRHSFGVQCATLGIPIEATAKLMGHRSIRTTAIYYKIIDTKSDEYMDRWG